MTSLTGNQFFKQRRSLAEVKGELLSAFLPFWGEAVLSGQDHVRLQYIDLLAGQGLASDKTGTAAVGKVLKSISLSTSTRFGLQKRMHVILQDGSKSILQETKRQIEALPFYEELPQAPNFLLPEGEKEELSTSLTENGPVLIYLDPFGYKLAQAVWYQELATGQADFLLILDPRKLKASFKQSPDERLAHFYGDQFKCLQVKMAAPGAAQKKEDLAVQGFESALRAVNYQTTTFKINIPGKDTTDFYLFLVSRNNQVHARFKELLLAYSEFQEDGVPRMGANLKPLRLLVPEYTQYLPYSITKLTSELALKAPDFHSMVLQKIYEKHQVGTPYSKENYFAAIQNLKKQGKVSLMNPKTGQIVNKLTFDCRVKFN